MSDSKTNLLREMVNWFLLLFAVIGGALVLLYVFGQLAKTPLIYALVTALPLLLALGWMRELLKRRKRAHYASLKENVGYLTYHEGHNQILLPFAANGFDLLIPSDEEWRRDMPEWAKDRKAEIMARLVDDSIPAD